MTGTGLMPTFFKATGPKVVQRQQTNSAGVRVASTVLTWAAARAGDLIVIEFACETNAAGPTTPAGYTLWPAGLVSNTGSAQVGVFYKIAAGGETGVTFTHGNNRTCTIMREISGGTISFATPVPLSTATPDPPAITPAGGVRPYLFIAGSLWGGTTLATLTAYSAGYLNGLVQQPSMDTNVASAEKAARLATEDPGAMAISAAVRGVAFTYAVN